MSAEEPGLRSHAHQAFATFATKIGMMALRLVRNIILARVLGAADRGAFAFLVALPELIIIFTSAGLQTSAARMGASEKHPGGAITLIAQVGLGLGIVFAGIAMGVFQLPWLFRGYYEDVVGFAPIVAAVTIILSVRFLINQFMIGAGWIAAMNLARILESVLLFVLMLGFFAFGLTSLRDVVISWGLAYLFLGGVLIAQILHYRTPGAAQTRASLVDLLQFGARGHADMIFQRILMRADYIFISMMLGAEALGYYAVAAVGAEALSAIPEAANAPLTRRLLRKGSHDQFEITMIATRWVVALTAVCGLCGGLIADWGVRLAFGDEFAPAIPALLMLIPAVVIASGSSFMRLALLGKEKPGVVSVIFGIAAVINLALNWVMIPHYGIVGAAAASTVCYMGGFVCLYGAVLRIYGKSWWSLFLLSPREADLIRQAPARLLPARRRAHRD